MHPQIKMDKPGKCPICAMDLIPLNNMGSVSTMSDAVHFTQEAIALANIQTTIVTSNVPVKEIRLYGKVQADERLLQSQTASISGRIEKLLVNFTGEPVKKGQTLALIYSPELVTAQQELLETAKSKNQQPGLYHAAREKLHLWRLSENQINNIEQSGKVKTRFEVLSGTSGIVTDRHINTGDYVSQGSVLFDVADLSQVWVQFDAYESDLLYLKVGDEINFNVRALPGKKFTSTIRFIDPMIDPVNRVSKVRVEIGNKQQELKPEMFTEGVISARLDAYNDYLVIPRSAVLWTGKRSVVYVKDPEHDAPVFTMKEIELGPELGNSYVVLDGLFDGDVIVTAGAFSVDASAQLQGKASMMNQTNE
jgi:Cu(I)/Ag(I) efflux system membrane fusion protein